MILVQIPEAQVQDRRNQYHVLNNFETQQKMRAGSSVV